jgi:hypothetical protein
MAEHMVMQHADWLAEGEQRFGADTMQWRFKCPSCGHVASVQDWLDAGAPPGTVAFSCVGRYTGADGSNAFKHAGGPCNYTSGGLFVINRLSVMKEDGKLTPVFEFAEAEPTAEGART